MLYAIYDKGVDISKLASKIEAYFPKQSVQEKNNIIIDSLKYVLGDKYVTEKNVIFYEEISLCVVTAEESNNYAEYVKSQMHAAPPHISALIHFPSSTKSVRIHDLIKEINGTKHCKVRGVLCYDTKNHPVVIKRATFIYSVYTDFRTYSVLSDELVLTPRVIYIEQLDCTNCRCHCHDGDRHKKRTKDDDSSSSSSSSEASKHRRKHKPGKMHAVPYMNQTMFVPDNLVYTFLPYLEKTIFQVFKIPAMENLRPLLFNSARGIIQIIYQYIPETYATHNFIIGRQKRFNKRS